MKNLSLICILVITAALTACSKSEQDGSTKGKNIATLMELKVINWGPQSTKIGTNPNKQADGSVGIWIEVSGTQGFGEAQVLIYGQPAKLTSVQAKLITAAITTDHLSAMGDKEVVIKQIETGKLFPVGIFKVTAE